MTRWTRTALLLAVLVSLPGIFGIAEGLRAATAAAAVSTSVEPEGTTADGEPTTPSGFFEIVFAGGWTGLLILLFLAALSIAAFAAGIEHLLSVRQDVLIPPQLPDAVATQLAAGSLSGADQACQAEPSVLSVILRAGLTEAEAGWDAVEKAMEDATAGQSARMLRKVEYLSVIGNIAPMVGLLGTVIGMIFAFQEVADSQGAARAAELASGIYQALVTTVGGLLVAIPALGAHAVFRNRVDQLIAETAYTALAVMKPLKRRLARGRPAGEGRKSVSSHPPPPPR